MGMVTGQNVGIDISEDFLDVHLHPAGREMRLPHDDEGTSSLMALLREHKIERVVMESTGGLQRRLVRSLQEAGYAVSVVNPERIWAYRRLVGRVAKTDRIENGKTVANIGTLWRSAHNLGAAFILTVGQRYKYQASDNTKAWRSIPLFQYGSFDEFVREPAA